ncbi:MAG: hypothetical protein ABIK93_08740 [candidate division WOR-3 bacterium]
MNENSSNILKGSIIGLKTLSVRRYKMAEPGFTENEEFFIRRD